MEVPDEGEDDGDGTYERFELRIATATGKALTVSPLMLEVSVAKTKHLQIMIEPSEQDSLDAFYRAIMNKARSVLPVDRNPKPGYSDLNRFLIWGVSEIEAHVMLDTLSMQRILKESRESGIMVVSFPQQITQKLVFQSAAKVPAEVAGILQAWGSSEPDEEDRPVRVPSPAQLLREGHHARDDHLTRTFHAGDELQVRGPAEAAGQLHGLALAIRQQHEAIAPGLASGQTSIAVFSEYAFFLTSLNSVMHTIDHMLAVRERSLFTNRSAIREMMFEVVRASTDELERRADFQAIIHDMLLGAIPDPPADQAG